MDSMADRDEVTALRAENNRRIARRESHGIDRRATPLLALGQQDIDASRIKPVVEVVARLRGERALGSAG
jgi:hypothetical protein